MSATDRFLDGRVAIITGAGRGLGREYALLFGALGAKVIVNDIGCSPDGDGADASPAQEVVDAIRSAGGDAVPNGDSVEDFAGAERLINSALDHYGDLHVVVNNAGFLRDRMLFSMSEQDFDDVVRVHLKGTFSVTHHAAKFWRAEDKAGRQTDRSVINTSSGAGLHGSVGQANYAAAKAGIAGLTLVTAAELNRYRVRANCIAPAARTRHTEVTPGLAAIVGSKAFDPSNVATAVACLAGADCTFTGQAFSIIGTAVGLYQGWSIAEHVESGEPWTVAGLAEAMTSLPRSVPVHRQGELFSALMAEA